jgi:hypothetical protein
MSNFRILLNRVFISWRIILIFCISLLSIHFFFLNDYHLQVKDSLVGVIPSSEPAQPSATLGNLDVGVGKEGSHGEGSTSSKTDANGDKGSIESPFGNSTEEYLAVCVAMKDQSRDLPEWLTHHYYHSGVSRFYIMDDGSMPPISEHEMDYGIPQSAITFHYQPRETREENMQMLFYQACQEKWGDKHTWIAYIDGDEFLESTGTETVEEVLRSFDADEGVGALGVHWKMHNSNGLLTRPASARKGFTTCLWDSPADYSGGTDDNHHIKSIVKTAKYAHWSNPHKFDLKDGAQTVTEHGDVVTTVAWRSPITRDRVALHHYAVKSRQEYEEKMQRSNGMSEPKNEGFWEHMEMTPTVVCNEMAKYNP